MSRGVIFQELHVASGDIVQLIPFVHAFYAFEFPLFYSHHNREGDVIVILSAMGTHQDDALGKTLFALAHFKALCSIASHFPSCLFPSIADNTHIIGPLLLYHLYMNIYRSNFMQ
jgi:hypothetical protein